MNNTIISENDVKAISFLKNEIEQHKETIVSLTKKMHREETRFDLITELCSLENDYTDKIKENENKILKLINKYI